MPVVLPHSSALLLDCWRTPGTASLGYSRERIFLPSTLSTSAGSTPEITPADSVASSAAAGTVTAAVDIAPVAAPASLSAEPCTACAAAWKPIFEWVPSQNGFFVDAPQRQRTTLACVGITLPFASLSSMV